MDTPAAQWPPEEMVMKSIEEIVNCSNPTSERKIRPQKEQSFNCPRCKSTNTKFCYYNNYSLSQPRYFCKTCRRYWTEGRNILVGGDSRKKNRPSTSSSSSSSISVTPRETSGAKDAGEGLGEPPDGGREWYEGEKTELESVDHSKEEDVFVDAKEHIPAVDLMSG